MLMSEMNARLRKAVNQMSFSCETIRKARKEHRCESCGVIIPKGQYYRIWAGKYDGIVSSSKYCRFCSCLIYHFSDGSYYENTDIFDIAEYDGLLRITPNEDDGENIYSSIFLPEGQYEYSEFMEKIAEFNHNISADTFIIKKSKHCTMPSICKCKYRRNDNTCREFYDCSASSFEKPEVEQ